MPLSKIFVPCLCLLLMAAAYRVWGWLGLALIGGGLVFWGLLHVSRLMAVLRRSANQPIGYVASAVMLNARLTQGASLLQVVALTQSLGEQRSHEHEEPAIYRWTDTSNASVHAEFVHGKLRQWSLCRPETAPDALNCITSPMTP